MTTSILGYYGPDPKWQVFSDNGLPGAGYKLWAFAAGTTSPLDTYSDPFCQTANANPVVFDAAGRATIVFKLGVAYKIVLTYADGEIDSGTGLPTLGSTIWSIDNYGSISSAFCTVASIADLKALNSAAFDFVSVLGYYVAGDQGGGLFYWNGSSSVTQDTGMVFYGADNSSGANNGRYIRMITPGAEVNVRWFGAKGDNSNNDTTALAAADTYAQAQGAKPALYLPNGAFKISSDPGLVSLVHLAGGASLVCAALTPAIKPIIDDLGYHFSCTTNIVFPASQIVHAEWFSSVALGGGSNDDTAAFQKALLSIAANGGVLEVAGASVYYKITGTLPLASNLTIRGLGNQSCFKFASGISTTIPMFLGAATAVLTNVAIRKIQLDGNATGQISTHTPNAITGNFSNSVIEDCLMQNFFGTAISLGIAAYPCTNMKVKGNLFYQNGQNHTDESGLLAGSIKIVNGSYIDIIDNHIEDFNSYGAYGICIYCTATYSALTNINIKRNELIGCNIQHFPYGALYAGEVVVADNKVDLSSVYGYSTPDCIMFEYGNGHVRISNNTLYPNLVSAGIHVMPVGSTAPAIPLRYEIDNNSIFTTATLSTEADVNGSTHSGISIESAQHYTAYVHDNNIVMQNDDTTVPGLVTGSYGICEDGSAWGSATGTVKYGTNTISGWAVSIYNAHSTSTLVLPQTVSIIGDLHISGLIYGTLGLTGFINGLQMSVMTTAISVSSGCAMDSTGAQIIKLASMFNKNIVNSGRTAFQAWTLGSGGGGVPATVSFSTGWKNIFIIMDSAGTVDIGLDDAVNLDANKLLAYAGTITGTTWIYYRRIGSVYISGTSGSYQVRPFRQFGDFFSYDSDIWANDYTGAGDITAGAAISLLYVPLYIVTKAKINVRLENNNTSNSASNLLITNYNDTSSTPGYFPLSMGRPTVDAASYLASAFIMDIDTVVSGSSVLIYAKTGHSADRVSIAAIGYADYRGKDGF
jgi:hypothetical protein